MTQNTHIPATCCPSHRSHSRPPSSTAATALPCCRPMRSSIAEFGQPLSPEEAHPAPSRPCQVEAFKPSQAAAVSTAAKSSSRPIRAATASLQPLQPHYTAPFPVPFSDEQNTMNIFPGEWEVSGQDTSAAAHFPKTDQKSRAQPTGDSEAQLPPPQDINGENTMAITAGQGIPMPSQIPSCFWPTTGKTSAPHLHALRAWFLGQQSSSTIHPRFPIFKGLFTTALPPTQRMCSGISTTT